ncbi:FtsX-like permease family protein [Streptomyces sp. NPDC048434]|uniref:FtsX-like permease family protein n=1 Tax=Streptomyces sp. NPDC048434 TaxID=3365549 RepID=UPI00371C015A
MTARPVRRTAALPTPVRLAGSALRTHKRRFAGTFIAVLLGVAFLGGTLVMGDTLRAGFDTMFGNATGGTAAVVRSADVVTVPGAGQGTRQPVSTSLVKTVEKVPGVAAAVPSIQGEGRLVGKNGKVVGASQGPPSRGGNWIGDAGLNPYQLAEGHAPEAPGQAVINRGAAKAGELRIGDRTVLRTPDPVTVTIVGIATFGGEDGMGQSTFTALTQSDAEKYFTPEPGRAASIQVRAASGVSQQQLVDDLRPTLPQGVEAITGARFTEESSAVAGGFLALFTTLLVVFAGISLLVATFSIHNTFAIVVAQRTRENALLRTLGAARRQLVGATLAEAAAVALAASAAGLLAALGIAAGLQALFPAIGFPFPGGPLVISGLSMALPLVVGVVVCLGSALLPALRAGRTAPMAALRDTAVDTSGSSRPRAAAGAVLGTAGIALTVVGATGTPDIGLTGAGALLTLIAFVVLGPVAASLAVRALGSPVVALRGVTGVLARRNALRSPKRTAATATALMTGVAVVCLFTVFGASLKAGADRSVSQAFAGDIAVGTTSFGPGGSGISPKLAPALARLPEVDTALGLGKGVAKVDGGGRQLTVTDPATLPEVLDLGAVQGSLKGLGGNGLAVARREADAKGWHLGSTAELTFADGARERFTVRALYAQPDLTGDYVISRRAWQPHHVQDTDTLVAVSLKNGVGVPAGKAAVQHTAASYGSPEVQTRAEYAASAANGVDTFLTLVYALLALAVVIALLGIANTLTLALHERTRELGLLRAVGQTRAQLRAMVRWESVLVAAFGTAGGLALGGFLGWALVRAADSTGSSVFTLPPVQLAAVAVTGVAAGAAAGLRPARRAARLDVLRAVATE